MVAAGSYADLEALLASFDEGELAAARAWYWKRGRASARTHAEQFSAWREDRAVDRTAVFELLVATLVPSAAQAASAFGWRGWSAERNADSAAVVVRALAARGREWCAEFSQAASEAKPNTQSPELMRRLVRLAMPLLAHFDLPMPTGPAYPQAWVAYYDRLISTARWAASGIELHADGDDRRLVGQPWLTANGNVTVDNRRALDCSLVELLAADPVLPDAFSACVAGPSLLGRLITSWFSAPKMEQWQVGPAFASLVEAGKLERARVVDNCLTVLTRRDTPSTERAIAQVLAALPLTGADVAGRVPLLQGYWPRLMGRSPPPCYPRCLTASGTPLTWTSSRARCSAGPRRDSRLTSSRRSPTGLR